MAGKTKLPWWIGKRVEYPQIEYAGKRRPPRHVQVVRYRLTVPGFIYLVLRDAATTEPRWWEWPVIVVMCLLDLARYLRAGDDYKTEIKIT